MYDSLNVTQVIIFCNNKRKVDWLTDQLRKEDFTQLVKSPVSKFPLFNRF